VIQRRGRSSFAAEAVERDGIARRHIRQKFQSYHAAEARVFGFIDDAHAAAAEFFEDAVMRNGFADHDLRKRRAILGRDVNQVNVG